jgi:hypothetical protein
MGSWRSRRLGGDVFRLLTDRDPTTLTTPEDPPASRA